MKLTFLSDEYVPRPKKFEDGLSEDAADEERSDPQPCVYPYDASARVFYLVWSGGVDVLSTTASCYNKTHAFPVPIIDMLCGDEFHM